MREFSVFEQKFLYNAFFWIIKNGFVFIFLLTSCHLARSEANETASVVQECLLQDETVDDLEEMQKFASQLGTDKVHFTACGFFELDLTLFISVAGTAITYIIILLQQ